jgi:ABC-type Zn uptake system ZnuABC Zn-binding protein ZnuA
MKEDSKNSLVSKNNSIAVSNFALYDLVKYISNDTQNVFMITPYGEDIKSFTPSKDIEYKIQTSKLTFLNGAKLEKWEDDFDFENRAVDISHYVKLQLSSKKPTILDPNYMFDIDNMIKATNIVKMELIVVSPQNKKLYEKNANQYIIMLNKLKSDYKKELSKCKKSTLEVDKNIYNYLAKKYNFTTTIKENSNNLLPINNITKKHNDDNITYQSIMRENLNKISTALECKKAI